MATIAKDTIYENFVLENKMTDLVNTNLDVNALFTRDDSLTTEAGLDKIVHVYEYDGKVEQLGKGDKNTTRGKVSWKPEKYTVKRYQQTFDYNDMDIMQDPYLLDVATAGASVVMANEIRDEYFEQLAKIGTEEHAPTHTASYDALTYNDIVDALAVIGREVESDMFIVMGLEAKADIRKDEEYKNSRQGEILYTGQFGTIAGVPCLFTKHKACANGDVYITAKDQVKFFVKKDGSVEQDRDIETKDNTVVYERHGVMALVDTTKSFKLTKNA
jgi:hypothetical protein